MSLVGVGPRLPSLLQELSRSLPANIWIGRAIIPTSENFFSLVTHL